MPRSLGQCKGWEKNRRDRLKQGFEELAKVLPSYDPSITISKLEILNQAQAAIVELKKSICSSSTDDQTSFKDEQLKKLENRIKKLLIRNEQLTNLFKDAGIKPPRHVGTVKKFRKQYKYSNRATEQQAKILQKKEMEKENVSSTSSDLKPKKSKLVSTSQTNGPNINAIKPYKSRKPSKKIKPSQNVVVLLPVPTAPVLNQQLLLVPNSSHQKTAAVVKVPPKKSAKTNKTKPSPTLPQIKTVPSNLGPGTLILGNGNVISLLPQPPIITPPQIITQSPQSILISNINKKPIVNNVNTPKCKFMQPCITKTTQINKVPIPALTSKYGNTLALLRYSANCNKTSKTENGKGTKRKTIVSNQKKAKVSKVEKSNDQKVETKNDKNEDKKTENVEDNKIAPSDKPKIIILENTTVDTDNNQSTTIEEINPVEAPPEVNEKSVNSDKEKEIIQEILDKEHETSKSTSSVSNNLDLTEKQPPTITSCTTSTTITSTSDDAIKNIDLNLHSDLSNDIFASLQVPPGCQNTESTSPTAAFLLAFPLVSSIKVTEVIDEENSDSQRETPTLLQIGGLDNSKPNDNLLNLDNFPFFSSKDICANYYNTKPETKNTETRSGYTENNNNTNNEAGFNGSQNLLDDKVLSKKPSKKLESINDVISSEQFILYDDKSGKDNNVFQLPDKNFVQPLTTVQDKKNTNNYGITDKLENSCSILPSVNNYNMTDHPTVSSSNNYMNYLQKNNNVSVRKDLNVHDDTTNQLQYIFKSVDNNNSTKTASNHLKQFGHNNFSVKEPQQHIENCSIKPSYNYNQFEIARNNKGDNCNKTNNDTDKTIKASESNKECSKPIETKTPCYFSSANSSTLTYRTDTTKICPPCTYESNRNPFYTNCNYSYNYSDNNFNQNYYKPETKTSCYSLNYENYQEYRKSDTFGNFTKDKRDKVNTSKPVNWMTTEQKSDCFLPSFPNQSYSFTSCISTDTDTNNVSDIKKTIDLTDKKFSLPNFLEHPHNFITPNLPTLVGDLALGNSLPVNETKYPKETKRKSTYDNQGNFLSVSQLVNQNKTEPVPARTLTRRLSGSGNKSKTSLTPKHKRFDKTVDKTTTVKPINNYDIFYEQKNRNTNKNVLSNYSAEALIGNQDAKKPLWTENIVPYFTTVDDTYMNQNQNFHNTYTHNSFQNNSYNTNSFIYTTPSISSSYLPSNLSNFDSDYSADTAMNYNKNCNTKNYRTMSKDDKHLNYPNNNSKKIKKNNQGNNNFDYPLLPMQGSTNSPILPDDFQTHTTFLPPTTPYACKNSLYQKQGNEFNTSTLLPLPGITRNNIQHPPISPSLNPVGTSLTNFNLSTIFPEINKGNVPTVHGNTNKTKTNSNYMEGSFSTDTKYSFSG